MKLTGLARMWLTRSIKPFVFKNEYDSNLSYESLDSLGLYIHIPFCRSICQFCPYCKVLYEKGKAREYIEALIREIHIVGSHLKEKKHVTSLYIGGGSPALCAEELQSIIDTLKQYFIINEGIGIELHPEDIKESVLVALKQAGVTKISIGIQSFDSGCLKKLGRASADYEAMFEQLRKIPFETISMDFIFAIPGQTFSSLMRDIDMAFSYGANHVAIYPFIEFSFNKNGGKAMNEKDKRKLLEEIISYCERKGYTRTSIWTFSKGIHQYSSMTRENFLGFGCSATTLLKDQFKINTFSIDEYIKRIEDKKLPTALTCRFTKRQRMVYYLFWTAYSTVVDPKNFEEFFGQSLKSMYGLELLLARLFSFAEKKEGKYHMTIKGSYYYHYFEGFYTLSYIDKMWNVLRLEAYPREIRLE